MATAPKTAAVAEIAESFRGSSAALLTEYRGLSVAEITELRRALGAGTRYAVVKNTLTKIAAGEAGLEGLDEMLAGPTAIAFVTGDPVEAAKGLRDFAKAHPFLVVKGGVLDGKPLTPEEITRLADLESREVLLAKLAGAMLGTLVAGRQPVRSPARAGSPASWAPSRPRPRPTLRSWPAAPARRKPAPVEALRRPGRDQH